MVGKFVLASVSQSHGIAGAGRNLQGHLTHPQLQQVSRNKWPTHTSTQVLSISMEVLI